MESIGAFLRQKRERLNLSLEEIAQNTKINKKYLEAIEEDRFELLPERLYHRIFVTAYARQLGIPSPELEQKLVGIEETAEWRLDQSLSTKRSKRLDLIFAGAGLLLGIVVVMLLIFKPSPSNQDDLDQATLEAIPNLPLRPVDQTAEAILNRNASDILELRIEALGKSPALVLAGTDTLFDGVLKKGEVSSFNSLQGFRVLLERPRQVRLYLNGKPVRPGLTDRTSRLNLEITPENLAQLVQDEAKL